MSELRDPHPRTLIRWPVGVEATRLARVLSVVVSDLVTGWAIAVLIAGLAVHTMLA